MFKVNLFGSIPREASANLNGHPRNIDPAIRYREEGTAKAPFRAASPSIGLVVWKGGWHRKGFGVRPCSRGWLEMHTLSEAGAR